MVIAGKLEKNDGQMVNDGKQYAAECGGSWKNGGWLWRREGCWGLLKSKRQKGDLMSKMAGGGEQVEDGGLKWSMDDKER